MGGHCGPTRMTAKQGVFSEMTGYTRNLCFRALM